MMKNKKIIFLAGLVFCLFLSLGLFNKAKADNKCCIITDGSQCSNATTSAQITSCTGTIIDGACPSDCKSSSGNSSTSGSSTTVDFPNPLKFSDVLGLLNAFLVSMRGVVAVVAIIFIVLGGIMYMMAGGNEKMVTRAKMCWTGAVIGLAIVLAAPSFLKEIMTILGSNIESGGNITPSTLTLAQIATNVLNLLLSVVGIIAIISLVVGGGMYLTAYGDEKRIETGKKIFTYSVIGIIVALSAVVLITEVSRLISGS
jgi:hypothetical protein